MTVETHAEAVSLDPITVMAATWSIGTTIDGLIGTTIERPAFEQMPIGLRVEDIVKRLPGITTGGAAGEDKDARVLGIDKEFTRTTVDGLPIPDSGEKREFNLDRLPSTFVESVSVQRLRRAEMEADGVAGRIDIKLRQIPDKPFVDMVGSYGGLKSLDNESHLLSMVTGARLNPYFGSVVGAAHSRIPGAKIKEKYAPTRYLQEKETESKATDATDLFADVGLYPNAGTEIHFTPKFFELDDSKTKRKDKYTPTGASNGYELEKENKVKRTIGGALSGKTTLDAWNGAIVDGRVAHFSTNEYNPGKTKNIFRANGTEDTAKREWETEDKTDAVTQVDGNIAVPFSAGAFEHMPKAGYLARWRTRERDKTKIVGVTPSVDPKEDYGIKEDVYAAYVQNTIGYGSWLTVTPGVRIEYAALDLTAGSGVSRSSSDYDILPSLPIDVRLSDEWLLQAGVSRLVNRPKFDELIPYENDSSAAKIVIGNPSLAPAKAWAYEAYLRYQTPHVSLGAGLSYRDIKDVIESVFTGEIRNGKDVEQIQNVGNGWVRAVILEQRINLSMLDVPVLQDISVTANQTFTQSELVGKDGIARRFKEQPPFFSHVTLDWRNRALGTSVSVGIGITSAFTNEDSNERRAAETTLDAKVTQRLFPGAELFVLGQNLTNQDRTKLKANGEMEVETAGRLVMVGVQGKF